MQLTSVEDGVGLALTSLVNDRLALLAGAGLSMAPPSSLPSAATLAQRAKQKYESIHGQAAQIPPGIDDQAEYFFLRHELATVYFRTLIDPHAFAGQPNPGHAAIADLLLVRALQAAVTTNVDTLIETAGQYQFGQVAVGIDGHALAALPPEGAPLLKLHGCRSCDPSNMVWARGQLTAEPVASRIMKSAQWLNVHLLNRDLLIVGFWTDWSYLNEVLAATLNGVNPSKVIVVDLATSADLPQKAPALFALGNRAENGFHHVQASGADFLAELRLGFSKSFVRQVLHSGIQAYSDRKGLPPDPAWTEPLVSDNESMWKVRRDLEGSRPNEPARQARPADEPLVGQTLLELRARGAVIDGPYWNLDGTRIRVLRAARPLHRIEKEFERETPPATAPDLVIAVGAEKQLLPVSIARTSSPSIARGNASRWITRPDAVLEFNL
ncbi:SIR2 family protein [Hydrogenophaga borbori]